MFDWLRFFEENGIEYVTRGHNARRGVAATACPMCGNDPSHHMGVSIAGQGWWHCWRNETQHAGKAPHRLIMAYLGCSYEEAARIAGAGGTGVATTDDTFDATIAGLLGLRSEPRPASPTELRFTEDILPLEDRGMAGKLALPYLRRSRDYPGDEALELIDMYGLRFAQRGPYAYRIVVPVVAGDRLVNWTGRSVAKSEELRYKSLSTDPEKAAAQRLPVALAVVKDCLLDYDELARGGRVLVVCEGPFDAFRVRFFGERYGIRSTCVFSKSVLPAQLDLLASVAELYEERYTAFDDDAFDTILGMPDYLNFRSLTLPRGAHDPAELTESQFRRLFRL